MAQHDSETRSEPADDGAVPPTGTWPVDRTDAANRRLAEMPSQWTVDKPVELAEAEGRLASLREEVAGLDSLDDSALGSW